MFLAPVSFNNSTLILEPGNGQRDLSEQHSNYAMVFKLVLSSHLRLTCYPFEISWFVLTLVRSILLLSLTKRSGHSKIHHRYIYMFNCLPLHLVLCISFVSFISQKDNVFPF